MIFQPGDKVRAYWWSQGHHLEVVADDGWTVFGYDHGVRDHVAPTFVVAELRAELEVIS